MLSVFLLLNKYICSFIPSFLCSFDGWRVNEEWQQKPGEMGKERKNRLQIDTIVSKCRNRRIWWCSNSFRCCCSHSRQSVWSICSLHSGKFMSSHTRRSYIDIELVLVRYFFRFLVSVNFRLFCCLMSENWKTSALRMRLPTCDERIREREKNNM